MNIEITNLEAKNYLDGLAKVESTKKFPIMVTYAILKNLRKLSEATTEYVKIQRDLFLKYGEKREDGIYIDENNKDALIGFINELEPVSKELVTVDIHFISIDDLNTDNSMLLTLEELSYLEFMIK